MPSAEEYELATLKYSVSTKPSWFRQLRGLIVRNHRLNLRNKTQIFSMVANPIWLTAILLTFGMNSSKTQTSFSVSSLPYLTSGDGVCQSSSTQSCIHFGYTNTSNIDPILAELRSFWQNSEPFQPAELYFASSQDMATFYNAQPGFLVAGVSFDNITDTSASYDIHVNHTALSQVDYITSRYVTVQAYVDRALVNVKRRAMSLPPISSPMPSKGTSPPSTDTGKGHSFISWASFVGQANFYAIGAILTPYYATFALQPIWQGVVNLIVNEKRLKIKSFMISMGVSNSAYIIALLATQTGLSLLTCAIVIGISYAGKIFYFSNFFLVLFLYLLFCISAVAFGYLLSISIKDPRSIFMITWIPLIAGLGGYAAFSILVWPYGNTAAETATFLISPVAFARGLQYIGQLEIILQGLTFANVAYTPFPRIYAMLIVDSIFYILMAWYLDILLPGPEAPAVPWNFVFSPKFWWKNSFKDEEKTEELRIRRVGSGIEPIAMVEAKNLRKVFKITKGAPWNRKTEETVAVQDLSLNLYRDEILSLLGHNGAGKTTTISILRGSILPTSGTVTFEGKTLAEYGLNNIGLCPQETVAFEFLSPYEMLETYADVSGLIVQCDAESEGSQRSLLKKYILDLLADVLLLDKAHAMVQTLSGGQKRKLAVAIAMIGQADVIFLDEPTTGMDVFAQRQIRKLLSACKAGRTMILTTHSMEEADALGDRIAVLSNGGLRDVGTALQLKHRYGKGYRLNFEKLEAQEGYEMEFNEARITKLVQRWFPGATILSDSLKTITYLLPWSNDNSSTEFPKLFNELENAVSEKAGGLGIATVGLSLTTLEEVFLHLTKDDEV